MSDTQKISVNNILRILIDAQNQLQPILQSNQVINDYTLLNGYISMVHSKFNKIIINNFICNEEHFMANDSKDNGMNSNQSQFCSKNINQNAVADILDLLWEKIQHPTFKWFQLWAKAIRMNSNDKPNSNSRHYVEFRQMNSKLTKYFKSVQSFYYSLIEIIVKNYDFSSVVADSLLLQGLNIKLSEKDLKNRIKLKDNSNSVLLIIAIHRCILYIGASHKYKKLNEIFSSKYKINDFEKSLKYFKIASLVLPSIGQTYLQIGMIYLQTNNYGMSVNNFTRSINSRIASESGTNNLLRIVSEETSNKSKEMFIEILNDIHNKEEMSNKIVDREVIEYYFTVLYFSYLSPSTWLSNYKNVSTNPKIQHLLINGINLDYFEKALDDKISTRYSKCINLILDNILTLIGGFDLLLQGLFSSLNNENDGISQSDQVESRSVPNEVSRNNIATQEEIKKVSLNHLNSLQNNYLEFAFRHITSIIKNVIMKDWNKIKDSFEYLAIIRITLGWIQSNKSVLQFAHRSTEFCVRLGQLVNHFLKEDITNWGDIVLKSPNICYYLEEDVIVKELSPLGYSLKDINFKEAFNNEDTSERLIGNIAKTMKLSQGEEYVIRIEAIFKSTYQLFMKNKVGIEWDSLTGLFILPPMNKVGSTQAYAKQPSLYDINLKKNSKSKGGNKTSGMIGITELEETLIKMRNVGPNTKNTVRGYSGSSVPTAPMNFSAKPSSILTLNSLQDNSDGSSFENVSEIPSPSSSDAGCETQSKRANGSKVETILGKHLYDDSKPSPINKARSSEMTDSCDKPGNVVSVDEVSNVEITMIENSDDNNINITQGNDTINSFHINMSTSSLSSNISKLVSGKDALIDDSNNQSFLTENDILKGYNSNIVESNFDESNNLSTQKLSNGTQSSNLKQNSLHDGHNYPQASLLFTQNASSLRSSQTEAHDSLDSQMPTQIPNNENRVFNNNFVATAGNSAQAYPSQNQSSNENNDFSLSQSHVFSQFPSQVLTQFPQQQQQQFLPQQFNQQQQYQQHFLPPFPQPLPSQSVQHFFQQNNHQFGPHFLQASIPHINYQPLQTNPHQYPNWNSTSQLSNVGSQLPSQQEQHPRNPIEKHDAPPGFPHPQY